MKTLQIEWRHLVDSGETCERCAMTGETLKRVIEELSPLLEVNGIKVTFVETALSGDNIQQSNSVLLNGAPLEELITGAQVKQNCCQSCSDLLGKQTCCRAIEYDSQTYDEIPEFLLRKAILSAAERLDVKD